MSKLVLTIITFISVTFFVLGLIFPIIATKQQILGIVLEYKEVNLIDSVIIFYNSSDYLLAAIIFLFTVLFPVLKFVEILNRIHAFIRLPDRISNLFHKIDKWSMLDVFLVALLLINFKMDSKIIVMKLKIGTSFIALSVITRMVVSSLIDVHLNRKV